MSCYGGLLKKGAKGKLEEGSEPLSGGGHERTGDESGMRIFLQRKESLNFPPRKGELHPKELCPTGDISIGTGGNPPLSVVNTNKVLFHKS